MSLIRITPPAATPVTAAVLADHLRMPQSAPETDQTEELARLIAAATLQVERRLDTALISQGWRWRIAHWCEAAAFPVGPVLSVDAVEIAGPEGAATPWAGWRLDPVATPPALAVQAGQSWPAIPAAGHAEIRFTAGYGAGPDDVPPDLRHAVLLLAAHYFENREAVADGAHPVPLGVASLVAPYRPIRL